MTASAQLPPGPSRNLLLESRLLGLLRSDLLRFLSVMTERYGPVWSFRLAHESVCMLNTPELVSEVLAGRAGEFVRTRSQKRLFGRAVGNGLIVSDGELWRRQRRLAQPAFHHQRICSYLSRMSSITEEHLARWRTGETMDFHAAMTRLTLEIVSETLLASRPPADVETVSRALGEIQRSATRLMRLGFPVPFWAPTPNNRRLTRSVRVLDSLILPLISQRRAESGDAGDLLSMFLNAVDAEDERRRMTDAQARDEIVTMFLAGHDTTSHLLTWTFSLLANHPEVYARVQREADEVLCGTPPGLDDLRRLTYTDMVLRESMRLYPPVYLILREPVHDLVLGGNQLRKGQMLFLSPWMLHRDPANFESPERFDPERFLPGRAGELPRGAYIPFGIGPHQCIGREFAVLESLIIVSAVARRFALRPAPGHVVEPEPLITLHPRNGLKMILTARG